MIETWTFNVKDVIWIVTGVGSGLSAYFALKQEIGKLKGKVDKLTGDMDALEADLTAKENTIYNRMEALKARQERQMLNKPKEDEQAN